MKRAWFSVIIMPIALIAQNGHAHPVTYSGGFAAMSSNGPMMSDLAFVYTFTPHLSAAARYMRLRNSTGGVREFYFPQISLLLKRWNEIESQANVYLTASYGLEAISGASTGVGLAGAEADWETRRYYASIKIQALRSGVGSPLDYARAKVGFAPYLAEFNDLHTWFMVQAEVQPETFGSTQVTPLLRFFHQNVLWEVGASLTGNWMFNFMVHF